jgi:hypothetical protein
MIRAFGAHCQNPTHAVQQDPYHGLQTSVVRPYNIVYLSKLAWPSILTSAMGSPRHRRLGESIQSAPACSHNGLAYRQGPFILRRAVFSVKYLTQGCLAD